MDSPTLVSEELQIQQPRKERPPLVDLAEYEVIYLPLQGLLATGTKEQPKEPSRSPSDVASECSQSSEALCRSFKSLLPPHVIWALGTTQVALIENKIQQIEFAEAAKQLEEEALIDAEEVWTAKECAEIQAAQERLQRRRQEVLDSKAALLRRVTRQRRLRKATSEACVAQLVASMIEERVTMQPLDKGSISFNQKSSQLHTDLQSSPAAIQEKAVVAVDTVDAELPAPASPHTSILTPADGVSDIATEATSTDKPANHYDPWTVLCKWSMQKVGVEMTSSYHVSHLKN